MTNTNTYPIHYVTDAASRAGSHFFSADALRFFGSRVADTCSVFKLPSVFGAELVGALFTTSERDRFSGAERRSTARLAVWHECHHAETSADEKRERFTIVTIGEFQDYAMPRDARRALAGALADGSAETLAASVQLQWAEDEHDRARRNYDAADAQSRNVVGEAMTHRASVNLEYRRMILADAEALVSEATDALASANLAELVRARVALEATR